MSDSYRRLFLAHVVAVLVSGCATPFGGSTAATTQNSVELDTAVYEVEDAIRYYQTHLRPQTRGLPPLTKVEFEFQTTTDVAGGLNAEFICLYVRRVSPA